METRFHGITSLALVLAAIVLAAAGMFRTSWALGFVYVAICAAASIAILYAYCAKCTCRRHCGHVFPGKIVMIFKSRPSGPYTAVELMATGLALLLLIGFPQAWLWKYTALLIAFWVMITLAVVQILTFVCRACDNRYCPARNLQGVENRSG